MDGILLNDLPTITLLSCRHRYLMTVQGIEYIVHQTRQTCVAYDPTFEIADTDEQITEANSPKLYHKLRSIYEQLMIIGDVAI